MADAKHTPGPWSFSPQKGKPGHCHMAQVWNSGGWALAQIEPTPDEAVATADAALIAAAPDLLEALKVFSELCIHWTEERQLPDNTGLLVVTSPSHLVLGADFTVHDLRRIRAAIAKAEGEV